MSNIVLDPQRWESAEAGDMALLAKWLVSEGDHVHAGDVIAMATLVHEPVEVQAPHDGVLEQIVVPSGERFSPGHVLARVIDF